MLGDCLDSVAFCDEVIVVDSGSTDETVALARGRGAQVLHQPWLGFAAQRNVALDAATGQWVLEVDADERVSSPLRSEIEEFLGTVAPAFDLAAIPRREMLLGRALGPAAKYPKYSHRLLRRDAYRHDELRTVHEGIVPEGAVYPLGSDLVHLFAASWRERCGDAFRYARLEAAQLDAPRTPGRFVSGALLRPSAKFLYRMGIDGAWRDGLLGVGNVAVDCATDTAVWLVYLFGAGSGRSGRSGVPAGAHYGSRSIHRGSPRLVGVALGSSATTRAAQWLQAVAMEGADVALISNVPRIADTAGVRERKLKSAGPLQLIRALDAEQQLRPIDSVVAFGRLARVAARFLPPQLRGHATGVQSSDPHGAVEAVLASRAGLAS